jgi:hypothetical protein
MILKNIKKRAGLLVALTPLFAGAPGMPGAASASLPPIRWEAPASFDPGMAGLGLPQLPGVTHEVLYAPHESKAPKEDGGRGQYESLLHGTYNHHTQAVIYKDKIIVYWTNHARDENGPGQRLLARWGTISADRNSIDWGAPVTNIVELVPPPAPVLRREPLEEVKDRRYVEGHLHVVDGRLRVTGPIAIYHGWTNDLKYRAPLEPVPENNFRELRDNDKGYRYDMRWDTGSRYYQEWGFVDGKFVPVSPMYLDKAPAGAIQLTPKESLKQGPLLDPYRNAPLLDSLSPAEQEFFTKRVRPAAAGKPRAGYARDTRHLAANGKHGLAHMASFQRRDGTCVIIRDNLIDAGHYFAAEAPSGGFYPSAVRTNLYGYAMPAAGELPDGTAWILGNSNDRLDFYITTSRDGVVFDRTWEVCHDATYWVRGLFKPARSGPQYPYSLQIGNAIWVFHSVGKEQIAAVRLPYASLYREETVLVRDDFAQCRGSHPESLQASAHSLRISAGDGPRAAWLPVASAQLATPGEGLRVRFQFAAGKTFGTKNNTLVFGLFNQDARGSAGYAASITPVSGNKRAFLSLLKQRQGASGPGDTVMLAGNEDFHRKLVKRLKYDVELILERTLAGMDVSMQIFGGDMPRAVVAAASDQVNPMTGLDTLGLVLGGAGIPDLTITNLEIIKYRTPAETDIPRGSEAHELESAGQTSAIHKMMSE